VFDVALVIVLHLFLRGAYEGIEVRCPSRTRSVSIVSPQLPAQTLQQLYDCNLVELKIKEDMLDKPL
jgi:hypothetical protein